MKMKNFLILKKVFLRISLVLLITFSTLYSQSYYHPFVDTLLSRVSQQSILYINRELTGDTSTIVNGQTVTIISRYWEHPANLTAARYIYEKFQSYGLQPRYDSVTTTCVNVLAKKTGTKHPYQYIIIGGHYDNIVSYFPQPDTIHGADDNASGVCAVLEAARILNQYDWDYSLIFAAWDEEEWGLTGSNAYANNSHIHNDTIINVINVDMISWDGNNDFVHEIITNTRSIKYANIAFSSDKIYVSELIPFIYVASTGGSDYYSFWKKGYNAIGFFESSNDHNPYYHTVFDNYSHVNPEYFYKMVKAVIASIVIIDKDYILNIEHNKLLSTTDTSARIAKAKIYSNHGVCGMDSFSPENMPRLYYSINDGPFNFVKPVSISMQDVSFRIPGQSWGNKISYYIAAQTVLDTGISSFPAGARGVNPPGTIPPAELITYYVLSTQTYCSSTVPRLIPPKQTILDSIYVQDVNTLYDLNLNLSIYHSNDSDLYIWLERSDHSQNPLSTANGGSGDNYINTTFDDEASDSIIDGTAPFTGSFVPEGTLSMYDNQSIQGYWTLRIFNNSSDITGQLVSWCINTLNFNVIGISQNNESMKYFLSQNYPNPFNPNTRIEFSIIKESDVKIIVFDILGREVSTLINDRLKYGSYNMNFNGTDLSSGMYFYSIYIDGALFETKKMVLLK
jgi:hypothetical protein